MGLLVGNGRLENDLRGVTRPVDFLVTASAISGILLAATRKFIFGQAVDFESEQFTFAANIARIRQGFLQCKLNCRLTMSPTLKLCKSTLPLGTQSLKT